MFHFPLVWWCWPLSTPGANQVTSLEVFFILSPGIIFGTEIWPDVCLPHHTWWDILHQNLSSVTEGASVWCCMVASVAQGDASMSFHIDAVDVNCWRCCVIEPPPIEPLIVGSTTHVSFPLSSEAATSPQLQVYINAFTLHSGLPSLKIR